MREKHFPGPGHTQATDRWLQYPSENLLRSELSFLVTVDSPLILYGGTVSPHQKIIFGLT